MRFEVCKKLSKPKCLSFKTRIVIRGACWYECLKPKPLALQTSHPDQQLVMMPTQRRRIIFDPRLQGSPIRSHLMEITPKPQSEKETTRPNHDEDSPCSEIVSPNARMLSKHDSDHDSTKPSEAIPMTQSATFGPTNSLCLKRKNVGTSLFSTYGGEE